MLEYKVFLKVYRYLFVNDFNSYQVISITIRTNINVKWKTQMIIRHRNDQGKM